MHEYTINKCAEMIERDRASIARVLRSVPPDGGTERKPLYRLATVVKALIEQATKPDGRRGNGDEARLANERARLASEQADKVAMQNAILRREYASVALMERGATIIMLTFRERCLAVPGKLAVFGPEVEMAARAEIYECLEELSRPILSADEPPWLDGDATDASDDAAADEEKK